MAAPGGFRDLRVYQLGYKLAMQIFKGTKTFPHDERYSMTSQIRRSSQGRPLLCLLVLRFEEVLQATY